MGRRILNRRDLRADFDAAERQKSEDDDTEEEEEKDEEEEEGEADADAEGEAAMGAVIEAVDHDEDTLPGSQRDHHSRLRGIADVVVTGELGPAARRVAHVQNGVIEAFDLKHSGYGLQPGASCQYSVAVADL